MFGLPPPRHISTLPHPYPGRMLRRLRSPVQSELRKYTAGRGSIDDLLRDHHFPTPSGLGRSNMVSSRMLSMIDRRPRVPVLRSAGDGAQRLLGKAEVDALHLEAGLTRNWP
jgi:hypothetical protein